MSTKEHAERLAQALSSLEYVEPISFEGSEHGTIKALCRVKPDKLSEWAEVVTSILRKAESLKGQGAQWDSHICRLYMLKEGNLVYGWLVAITAQYMDETLSHLVPTIKAHALGLAPKQNKDPIPVPSDVEEVAPVAKKPIVPRAVPDADAKGNPRVHPSHRVTEIAMGGLHPMYDRNAPSEDTGGKGSYGMFTSKRLGSVFKPPAR